MNTHSLFPELMSPHVQVANHPLGLAGRGRRRAGLFRLADDSTSPTAPRRLTPKSTRARRRSGQDRPGRQGRLSGLSDRPRHRAGLQHRGGPHPGRRPDQQDRVQGRPVRQGRRHAGRDRSATVPGSARSGHRQEGAGRSQSRQRQSRSAALYQARRIRDPAADRYPALHRGAADGADRRPTRRRSPTPRPSSITPPSRRRSPASSGCARSTSATSSMPRPRPAS